jgi:hypothetical protein
MLGSFNLLFKLFLSMIFAFGSVGPSKIKKTIIYSLEHIKSFRKRENKGTWTSLKSCVCEREREKRERERERI